MPNNRGTQRVTARDIKEWIQRAFARPGAEALQVRTVRGQVTFDPAVAGFGFERKTLAGADEALPAATIADPRTAGAADKARLFDLRQFSSARLFLEFLAADGSVVALDNTSTATVTAWRRQDTGAMVKGEAWANLGHRVEQLDDGVVGRYVLFQITALNLVAPATDVRLRVAGEGLGFVE